MSQVQADEGGSTDPDEAGAASALITQITKSPEALQSFTQAVMPTLLASLGQTTAQNTGGSENGRFSGGHEDLLRGHVHDHGELGQSLGRGQLETSNTAENEGPQYNEGGTSGSRAGNAALMPQDPGSAAQYPGNAAQYAGNPAQLYYPGNATQSAQGPGNAAYLTTSQPSSPAGTSWGSVASGNQAASTSQGFWPVQMQPCWPGMWPQWGSPFGWGYNAGPNPEGPVARLSRRTSSQRSPQQLESPQPLTPVGHLPQTAPSSIAESDENCINPFLPEGEREELLESKEDLLEDEDIGPPPAKKRHVPGESTTSLLRVTTEKPLKNDKRNSILARYPVPSCDPAHPPKLDDSVLCVIPQQARTYDRYLSKMQQFQWRHWFLSHGCTTN